MEEVMSSSLQGFVFEKNLNSRRSESKDESLGKSFYSLSFNFQKFRIHSINHTTNKIINQNYLFNITFQNLEFWAVTNLPPLKWISSARFSMFSSHAGYTQGWIFIFLSFRSIEPRRPPSNEGARKCCVGLSSGG